MMIYNKNLGNSYFSLNERQLMEKKCLDIKVKVEL